MKDVLGMVVSALCIIHCALSPILLFLGVSSLGLAFFQSEWMHLLLAFPMIILAFMSFPKGFRMHQHRLPAFMGMIGVLLLLSSFIVGHEYEVYVAVLAGALLITGHMINRKFILNYTDTPATNAAS